jgi:hypothetical protein
VRKENGFGSKPTSSAIVPCGATEPVVEWHTDPEEVIRVESAFQLLSRNFQTTPSHLSGSQTR